MATGLRTKGFYQAAGGVRLFEVRSHATNILFKYLFRLYFLFFGASKIVPTKNKEYKKIRENYLQHL